MVARAGRADDVRTQRGGDLDGEEADAAGRAVHQHPVALADVERLGERLVGGQPGQRQRAGLGEASDSGLCARQRCGAGTSSAAVPHWTSSRRR